MLEANKWTFICQVTKHTALYAFETRAPNKVCYGIIQIRFSSAAMVMADVTVLTDLYRDEEKKVKEFLETLGKKLRDAGVRAWNSEEFSSYATLSSIPAKWWRSGNNPVWTRQSRHQQHEHRSTQLGLMTLST